MKKVFQVSNYHNNEQISIGEIGHVPMEFADCGLSDLESVKGISLSLQQTEIKATLCKLVHPEEYPLWNMVIIGAVGNGKTMLGSAAVNTWNHINLRNPDNRAEYTTQSEIVMRARNFKEHETVTDLCRNGLLFIDEIDSETYDINTRFLLSEIIMRFYDKRDTSRLILAGNLSSEEFTSLFSMRIKDRLKTGANYVLTDSSYRGI